MNSQRKNAAALLYEEYWQRLRALQESCLHPELTEWMGEWWAPGHFIGRQVQLCTECNKILHVKRKCSRCGKELIDNEAREGDGQRLPLGAFYCSSCYAQQ
jgi:formylmethanofuran dehydrogenase subunit E